MESSDNVLGHYTVTPSGRLEPLLAESSPLFRAIVADDVHAVSRMLNSDEQALNGAYNVLYWTSQSPEEQDSRRRIGSEDGRPHRPMVSVKSRSLLAIAAGAAAISGRMQVLKLLLARDPRREDAAFMMCSGAPHEKEVVALMDTQVAKLAKPTTAQLHPSPSLGCAPTTSTTMSGALSTSSSGVADQGQYAAGVAIVNGGMVGQSLACHAGTSRLPSGLVGAERDSVHSEATTMVAPSNASDQGSAATGNLHYTADVHHHLSLHRHQGADVDLQDGLPYSTYELTQPEYCTDDFRMFAFKVLRCSKRFAHDWRACPFAHPTENARRRDPRSFRYCALACPDYKQGFCVRGDLCPYAHGVFEAWLHPSRYRTQLCKDGANCHRPICFFAHSLPELRSPTYTWTPSSVDDVNTGVTPQSAATASMDGTPAAANNMGLLSAQNSGALNSVSATPHADGGTTPGKTSSNGSMSDGIQIHRKSSGGGADPGMAAATAAGAMAPPAPGPAAAAMFGFTAPRMSNAFARRHGLNPKDNAMLNLQKIALQSNGQAGSQQMTDHLGRLFHGYSNGGPPHSPNHGHVNHHSQMQPPDHASPTDNMYAGVMNMGTAIQTTGRVGKAAYGPPQHAVVGMQSPQMMASPAMTPSMAHTAATTIMAPAYGYPGNMMSMQGHATHDPSALVALNHHLASLSLHPGSAAAAYATGISPHRTAAPMLMGFGGMAMAGNGYPHHDAAIAH